MAEATPSIHWGRALKLVLLSCLFVIAGQLNGSNGEWTGLDDLADRVRRNREANTNKYRKNPGAGGRNVKFGPPELPPPQRDRPPDMRGDPDECLGKVVFKQSGSTYSEVNGLKHAPHDARLTDFEIAEAGRALEKYNVAQERLFSANLPDHLVAVDTRESLRDAKLTRRVLDDHNRELFSMNLKSGNLYRSAELGAAVTTELTRLGVECDQLVLAGRIQEIQTKEFLLKTTYDSRINIARMEYNIAQELENGPTISKSLPVKLRKYLQYVPTPGGNVVLSGVDLGHNYARVAEDATLQQQFELSQPLVQVPYFLKNRPRSFLNWFLAGLLSPFYRQRNQSWLDGEHSMSFYPELLDLQDARLNAAVDNNKIKSLLSNFRFLGFESETVRSLYTNGLGFFEVRGFTSWTTVLVHPVVVQAARRKCVGKLVCPEWVIQVEKDLDWYNDLLPEDVVAASIRVGCQQMDAIGYLRSMGFAKAKFTELDK